jgi:uncharacterized UBP type Zn finger protein
MYNKLITYNKKYAFEAHGLLNPSNICYLNSLIQGLISCPAFVQMILLNGYDHCRVNVQPPDTLSLLLRMCSGQISANPDLWDNQYGTKLLKALNDVRESENKDVVEETTQYDPTDALNYLIEKCINRKSVTQLFTYIKKLKCDNCNTQKKINIYSDITMMIYPDITSNIALESFISNKCHTDSQELDCVNCKKKYASHDLISMPNILVLVYPLANGYNKWESPYTETLTIRGKNNTIKKYMLVSLSLHIGLDGSGHYVSYSLRKNGDGTSIYLLNDSKEPKLENNWPTDEDSAKNVYMAFYHVCD